MKVKVERWKMTGQQVEVVARLFIDGSRVSHLFVIIGKTFPVDSLSVFWLENLSNGIGKSSPLLFKAQSVQTDQIPMHGAAIVFGVNQVHFRLSWRKANGTLSVNIARCGCGGDTILQ